MLLSLDWLKEFIDIPKSLSPEELGLKLSLHTVEVEKIEKQADQFNNVVAGKVLEIKKHPNADRLKLVKVDVKSEVLDIVCGAPNIEAGQMVPVALPGAVLPCGLEIKEAEVRGEKSRGMVCAEDELGLGGGHSGIMELDGKKAKAGMLLADYLNLDDIIIEVDNKSLTNRPDLWSHYGIAREIAVFLDVKLKGYYADPLIPNARDANQSRELGTNIRISVKVEDKKLCPRYMAVAMSGIKVGPSPEWMQKRLIAAGSRPINNIVDAANYIMLEIGQPLHAFDRNLIAGDKIIVRKAKQGETLETLDGEKRKLDSEMLVIADKEKAVAIAGIMGGAASEVGSDTTEIILESANFDFVSIRKTSQKLGLRSEASMRFEKSLDPNLCETALAGAVELIKRICPGAEITGALIDEKNFSLNQWPIELDLRWLNEISGEKISAKEAVKTLDGLGFEVKQTEGKLKVKIPSWRASKDIALPEDLAEEIARIRGYDKFVSVMPAVIMQAPIKMPEKIFERKIKSILTGASALAEVYNYSFVGEEQLAKLGIDQASHIKLANPISSQHTLLRKSLAPNLINNIKLNQPRYEKIGIFEIGSIFLPVPGGINKDGGDEKLPYQEKFLGIACAGSGKEETFGRAKAVVEYLISSLDLNTVFSPVTITSEWADSETSAAINIIGQGDLINIGMVCRLSNSVRNNVNIKKETFIAEMNLRELFNVCARAKAKKYAEFEKYPPVMRDLAFAINEKILYIDIRDEILKFNNLIKEVELFDVYQGSKLGAGKKSLAFHIVYSASDRTLISAEVDELQGRLIKHLERKFEARIRNF